MGKRSRAVLFFAPPASGGLAAGAAAVAAPAVAPLDARARLWLPVLILDSPSAAGRFRLSLSGIRSSARGGLAVPAGCRALRLHFAAAKLSLRIQSFIEFRMKTQGPGHVADQAATVPPLPARPASST